MRIPAELQALGVREIMFTDFEFGGKDGERRNPIVSWLENIRRANYTASGWKENGAYGHRFLQAQA